MSDDLSVQTAVLGVTRQTFICTEVTAYQEAVLRLIAQTEYQFMLFTPYFEPRVYDNADCLTALEDLALRGKHGSIRILLGAPQQVLQRGHCVLELSKRLSSFIAVRRPNRQHRTRYQDEFLIADGIGYLHRPYPDALKAQVNFAAPQEVHELSKIFEQVWAHAEHDPYLRRLTI